MEGVKGKVGILVDKRQWAETGAQNPPPEHEEELYCVNDHPLEQIDQRGWGVSLTGYIQEPSGHSSVLCAPG